jgi:NADPH:quinone reductase-like Zn-dependent oxidoreductase
MCGHVDYARPEGAKMRAVTQTSYGSPDVLRIEDVAMPTPEAGEVLVRIHVTTVTPPDCAFRKGDPFATRLFTGLRRPKQIPGCQFAGEIVQVGADVSLFQVGDKVFGDVGSSFGAHAEYTCVREGAAIEKLPEGLTEEEAVSVADGALTALPFIRDTAKVRAGQEILVIGASGSIGSAAVELAKYYGAVVTGVCSTANLDLVRSVGADHVVDYTTTDFTQNGGSYDLIFDSVGKSSFRTCKRALKPRGVYLTTVPSLAIMVQMPWTALIRRRRAVVSFTGMRLCREWLSFIKERVEAGDFKSRIDRRYPFEQIAEAHRYVDTGHKRGSVVVAI